jgi:hypothetical protein
MTYVGLLLFGLVSASAQDTTMDRGTYDTRLRSMQAESEQLASDVFRSELRLRLLQEQIDPGFGLARTLIVQEAELGPFYRLVRAEYGLDGTAIYQARDPNGLDPTSTIYEGGISTGAHVLSIRLDYVGTGLPYLEGYRFQLRTSHTFTPSPGRNLRIRVHAFEDGGPTRAYQHRPTLEIRERLE